MAKHVHGPDCNHDHEEEGHDHEHTHNHANPFDNLDQETQEKIQELQMLEQTFQQHLMQKNAFSMEGNETDLIIKEVEKSTGEISRIIGGQVVIKSSKEAVIQEMKKKKELIDNRLKAIDEQEGEFAKKIESLRNEIIQKIRN